jgi:hypothetical protein
MQRQVSLGLVRLSKGQRGEAVMLRKGKEREHKSNAMALLRNVQGSVSLAAEG